jgi:hypothetical protein
MTHPSKPVLQAQIKRTSRIAAGVLAVSVIATPLLLAIYVMSGPAVHHPWLVTLNVGAGALEPPARAALFAATLAALAPMLWGLNQVRRMFIGYAEGKVFTERAAMRFRRFATALLLTAITGPLALAALSLTLSWLGTVTPPAGVISVSSTDAGLLLVGLVLRVIASVLHDAARLAEENASFV